MIKLRLGVEVWILRPVGQRVMSLLDLCDSTAKLYYMLCWNKYTNLAVSVLYETVWNIILYCYCYFSASIHVGVSDVAEAE